MAIISKLLSRAGRVFIIEREVTEAFFAMLKNYSLTPLTVVI